MYQENKEKIEKEVKWTAVAWAPCPKDVLNQLRFPQLFRFSPSARGIQEQPPEGSVCWLHCGELWVCPVLFFKPQKSSSGRHLGCPAPTASDTQESLHFPSVHFAFTTKGFCPNRAGFVSVLAELFPCMNNPRVKQTCPFSHLTCSNELKFHWHTAGKPTDHINVQPEDKICLCEAPPTLEEQSSRVDLTSRNRADLTLRNKSWFSS